MFVIGQASTEAGQCHVVRETINGHLNFSGVGGSVTLSRIDSQAMSDGERLIL